MWTGKVQCRICATSVVWCCDVVQRQVWNVVMRCGMVWCMGNVAVCWCKMWNVVVEVIPSNAEWFDAQLDMQNDGRNALWDVWCGMECVLWVVWCVIYIWMWRCAWCGARWNVGMWNGVLTCGGVESRDLKWIMVRCEMWCDVYVKCGAMWNVAFSDLVWCEMQNVRCRIWRGVDCGASLCGMLHNAKCGKLGDVKCDGVELWWWRMWHMQCAVVVWRQMWKIMQCVVMSAVVVWRCKIKMRWYAMWNMVWCEMCCGVECGCDVV